MTRAPSVAPSGADAPAAGPSSTLGANPTRSSPAYGDGPFPSARATEVDLLDRAQDALSSRPGEALALADEHAVRYPAGVLAQEREVIAIDALVRLGRPGDARARADRFFRDFPASAHRPRIDAILEGPPQGPARLAPTEGDSIPLHNP